MTSKELQEIIKSLISGRLPEDIGIEEQRDIMEAGSTLVPLAPDVKCEPVNAGGISAEYVSVPESDERCVIYYLHGGGYFAGSIATHRELASRLARSTRARALLIDYRLAPECPFPAAVDDAVAGYRWLLSTGIKPANIIVAGDSAGGGLTIATLVALRDADDPLPAAAVGISPWVDLACAGESYVTKADIDPVLTGRDSIVRYAGLYLGEVDPHMPLASPLYADLAGLPPLLIMVGTAEILYDDSAGLAEKAQAAGVAVVFEPWEDMIHDWPIFAYMLPEGQQAIERIGKFVKEHIGE